MVANFTNSRRVLLTVVLGTLLAISIVLFALWPSLKTGETPDGNSDDEGEVSVIGTWTADDATKPYLTFEANDRVSGHDGCNGFSGRVTFSADGQKVFLHDLLGTLKACPGVDTWLRKADSAVVDGDVLRLFDEADQEIGQLRQR